MEGLILGGVHFELETSTRETSFSVYSDSGEGLEYSVDCAFKRAEFKGEYASPELVINPIETSAQNIEDLVGMTFEVNSIEESDAREDLFYIFEHEPMENYKLTILEIRDSRAHISCTGTAVDDGYADPYTTVAFEADCRLPVITDVSDWEKLGI